MTKNKSPMQNITINIPECYEENIQKLIKMGLTPNRSECIRTAIREYLQKEYHENLKILEFFSLENSEHRYPASGSNQSIKKKLDIKTKQTTKEE